MSDRMPIYDEQARFTDLLNEFKLTEYDKLTTDGSEISKNTKGLLHYLHSNVLYTVYYCSFDAFKQNVFPFLSFLIDVPLKYGGAISDAEKNIKALALARYGHSSAPSDTVHFLESPYNYCWWNNEISHEIAKLFGGKRIHLENAGEEDSAVARLTNIELGFRTNDTNLDAKLKKNLKSFRVSLTHMGERTTFVMKTKYMIRTAQPTKIISKRTIGLSWNQLRSCIQKIVQNCQVFKLHGQSNWIIALMNLKN